MEPAESEKQSVRLTIFNRSFSILVSGDPSAIQETAEMIDNLMFEVAKSGNYDTARVAIFACLQIGLRLREAEQRLAGMKEQVDHRVREFAELLDEAIEQ